MEWHYILYLELQKPRHETCDEIFGKPCAASTAITPKGAILGATVPKETVQVETEMSARGHSIEIFSKDPVS